MTTEEKAKAYEMALEAARKELGVDRKEWEVVQRVLHNIFPELRESEDERIRKAIVSLVYEMKGTYQSFAKVELDKMVAWLEKQKDQKPAWSEVELLFRGEKVTVKRPFYRDDKGRGYSTAELDEDVAWNALRAWCEKKGISLYDLYPKAEWSEEDEKIVRFYEDDYNNNLGNMPMCDVIKNRIKFKDWLLNRLKSLRPSWKPSEELVEALHTAAYIPEMEFYGGLKDKLRELDKQLKRS